MFRENTRTSATFRERILPAARELDRSAQNRTEIAQKWHRNGTAPTAACAQRDPNESRARGAFVCAKKLDSQRAPTKINVKHR